MGEEALEGANRCRALGEEGTQEGGEGDSEREGWGMKEPRNLGAVVGRLGILEVGEE